SRCFCSMALSAPKISTLSLHDALPISHSLHHVEAEDVVVEGERAVDVGDLQMDVADVDSRVDAHAPTLAVRVGCQESLDGRGARSEERRVGKEGRGRGSAHGAT